MCVNESVFLAQGDSTVSVAGSSSRRASRHNSGDQIVVEHDPHVMPQPIYIATMRQMPPQYDALYPRDNRLESVDEEADDFGRYGANMSDDRTFLLLDDSGKGANA